MELIIIRHGETEENRKGCFLGVTDALLNENGLTQAYSAAEKLSDIKLDKIYTSPLKRAAMTASIIGEKLACNRIYTDDSLMERNFGKWDGLTADEIQNRYPDDYKVWLNDCDYCIDGAESSDSVSKRVKGFINSLINQNSPAAAAVVTHLGCIRYMLAFLLGLPDEASWRFKVDNGSITRIQINKEGYAYLTKLNC